MTDQEFWREGSDLDQNRADAEQPKPLRYEVVKPFSHGRRKVKPGDPMPDVSEVALASLLRKGVVVLSEE